MINNISTLTLKELLESQTEMSLIDIREEGEFSQGHILLANCIPLSYLELRIADLIPKKFTKIIIMDLGTNESNTIEAATKLINWGYFDVSILKGGLMNWKNKGNSVFQGVNVPSKAFGEYIEKHYRTPSITAEELKTLIDTNKNIIVIDSRPAEEFKRMSIPGAINVPGGELVYRIHDLVTNPETEIIINCAGRTRSIIGAQSLINAGISNNILALENGTMGWHLAGFNLSYGSLSNEPNLSQVGIKKAKIAANLVAEKYQINFIDNDTLTEWKNDINGPTLYLLDVRSPREFNQSHLIDSRNAPGGQLIQALDTYVGVRNSRIVLIDDTEVRSIMTASWLIQMGWNDVHVLSGGITSKKVTTQPHYPIIYGTLWTKFISPKQLERYMNKNEVVVIDINSSLKYRDGHIPGAYWSVRSRLCHEIKNISLIKCIVISSDNDNLAKLAANDLSISLNTKDIYVLEGGTNNWSANSYPLEKGLSKTLGPTNDIQYKPYDNLDRVEEAMRQYLEWEIALTKEIALDNTLSFAKPNHLS